MTTRVLAVLIVVGICGNASAESPKLIQAKVAYLKTVCAAEDELISACRQRALEATSKKHFDAARDIQQQIHKIQFQEAPFVLGETDQLTREDGDSSSGIPGELSEAWSMFLKSERKARASLADAHQFEIRQAGEREDLNAMLRLQEDVTAVRAGSFPWGVDRLKGAVVNGARYVGDFDGLVDELESETFPDEFSLSFSRRLVRIEGTATTDITRIGNRPAGHFGKAVLCNQRRQEGVLKITEPAIPGSVTYHAVFVRNGQVLLQQRLPVEVGTIYEWSFEPVRQSARFEMSKDGVVIAEATTRNSRNLFFGFAATARKPGQKVGMNVFLASGLP